MTDSRQMMFPHGRVTPDAAPPMAGGGPAQGPPRDMPAQPMAGRYQPGFAPQGFIGDFSPQFNRFARPPMPPQRVMMPARRVPEQPHEGGFMAGWGR